ncbi:thermonuclease family protein [Blastomonas sp.]|uniref:thermonuclease family protein n=1 Tax=Blastomonas sp. TaxID=1909299 RepID=UPI00391D5D02
MIILAVLLAALTGWNLNAWLMPVPQEGLSPAIELEAPDPWAQSREQRRLLEAQEDAPAPVAEFAGAPLVSAQPDTVSARFGICGGGARVTCVVDGDTIWLRGQKIRIADIDTPEISSPRCPAELQRGRQATQRLVELLNTGPFTLEPIDRAQDRYGRALFVVTRGGASVGGALVDEGLAVWYGNGRPDWC